MAKLGNLIFQPIQSLMTAFKKRAVLRHQLLLQKRLENQRITTGSAFDQGQLFKDRKRHARDESID
jgi:hypothetical protein